MAFAQRKVFVVDDDVSVLHTVAKLIEAGGHTCQTFASLDECLCELDHSVDCVVTDLMMPDVNGSEIINKLSERGLAVPVVVVTGFADVPTVVRLMERGVVTVLEKPFRSDQLLDAISRATKDVDERRNHALERQSVRKRFDQLNADEKKIMRKMIGGAANKVIAAELTISARTLDRRRRIVFDTMQVNSVAELALLAERYDLFGN